MADSSVKRVTPKEALLLNPYEIDFIVMKDGSIRSLKKSEQAPDSSKCQVCSNCGQRYQSQQTTQQNVLRAKPEVEVKEVKLRGPGGLTYLDEIIVSGTENQQNQQTDQNKGYTEGNEAYNDVNYYDQQQVQEDVKNDYNQENEEQNQYYEQEYQEENDNQQNQPQNQYYEEYQQSNQPTQQQNYYYEEYQQKKQTTNQYPTQPNIQPRPTQPKQYYQQEFYNNQSTNYKPPQRPQPQKFVPNRNYDFVPQQQLGPQVPHHNHGHHHHGRHHGHAHHKQGIQEKNPFPPQRYSNEFVAPRSKEGFHKEFIIEEKPLPGQKSRGFEYVQVGYEPKGKKGGVFYEEKVYLRGKNAKTEEGEFVEDVKQSQNVYKQQSNVLRAKKGGNVYYGGVPERKCACGGYEKKCCEKCGRPFERSDENVFIGQSQNRNFGADNYRYHEISGFSGSRQQGFDKRW